MNPIPLMLAALVAAVATPRPVMAQADSDRTIPDARVPAPVKTAFRRVFPNAIVRRYSTEVEGGRTIYEVELLEGGQHRSLDITPDGQVLEVETQLTVAQLPPAVVTAAQRGGAHIVRAERAVAGHDTTYELRVQGRRGELKFRPDGRAVSQQP